MKKFFLTVRNIRHISLFVLVALLSFTAIAVTPVKAAALTYDCNQDMAVWTKTEVYLPGQFCLSYNGGSVLKFQTDGNFVWYLNGKVLWSSNTYNKNAKVLALQSDGNVVIYNTSGQAIYASSWGYSRWGTTTESASKALLLLNSFGTHKVFHDIKTSSSSIYSFGSALNSLVWGDGADPNCTAYDIFNYSGLARTFTKGNFCLTSTRMDSRVIFQSDGQLVQYVNGKAKWWSNTAGKGDRLVFQMDGNVVIYDAASKPVWALSWEMAKRQQNFRTINMTNGNGVGELRLESGGLMVFVSGMYQGPQYVGSQLYLY